MLLTPYRLTENAINNNLPALAEEILSAVGRLGSDLHTDLKSELASALEVVNSYYSNAMEGNPTRIAEVFAVNDGQLTHAAAERDFQLEHLAHIQTAKKMRALLNDSTVSPADADFLKMLHHWFYEHLPESMRYAKTVTEQKIPIKAGAFRERPARVASFHPPPPDQINECMNEFSRAYGNKLSGSAALMALAASHHRFQWIHPFADGNGRVGRLFTEALMIRFGLDGRGLFSITRGFARQRAAYDQGLAAADVPRRNDLDGPGNLSLRGLQDWTQFFLTTLLDQITFMGSQLEPKLLSKRLDHFLASWQLTNQLSRSEAKVLRHLFFHGATARGFVGAVASVERRQTSKIVQKLLSQGLVQSVSPKGKIRLRINRDLARALLTEFFEG